ncbi:MAG: prephenate dehydratase [Actinobacteria bacterium]|uniref:prephenate dehydratase n=1 Tax=freshwater metagenome TaxID=449393 RepID=A0A6J6NPS4_9ZZZZ|nr:prephenate dehydratase [Actinomycetota bacterium]
MSVYSYLGPAGTFTEAALIPLLKAEDKSVPAVNVTAALDAVRSGTADYAIVPIENSVEGVVARTLDELASGAPLLIIGESILSVSFALMVKPGMKISDIKRLATHPHAEAQCREYIAKKIPGAEVIMTASTAAGAEAVAKGEADGALAAAVAAKNFNLEVIAEDVGDKQAAVTRFVTVSRPGKIAAPTGSDRTSLVVFIAADHSGALLEILTEFAVRGVNLTFIQSRPNGVELGQYHFIIDVEGHIEDARVGDTLKALYRICADVRFLGSYARADKVLPTLNKATEDKAFDTAETWLKRIRSGDIKK